MNLTLGSKDRNDVARRFLARESNGRVGLGLDVVNEDGLLAEESSMIPPRNRDCLDDEILVFRTDQLHDALFEVFEVHSVLGGSSRDYVVFVVVVTSESGELFSIGELDVNSIFLHDSLNVLSSNSDDSFVVSFGNVERDFGGKLLLKHRQSVKGTRIISSDVDEEIVVVERFELDLDIRGLHDLVQLSVLLP